MNTRTQLANALQSAFDNPNRGVVGLVDDLLRLCSESALQLEWHRKTCRVRSLENGFEEVFEPPVQKAVFRAALGRVAALCNERHPNSVSPYEGTGELIWGGDSPSVIKVTFTNTNDEQKLESIPAIRT